MDSGAILAVLPTWEGPLKRMLWDQLGSLAGLRVLDFGSGTGATAAHLARANEVVAVEPHAAMIDPRWAGGFAQVIGGVEQVAAMPEAGFDAVLCHNVLEYVEDKPQVLRALVRVLRPGGMLSVVKHNRPGRVMQMAVLLNDFDHANELLDGKDGTASQFGVVRYYEDADILRWCPGLRVTRLWGLRTFWDLQQNQDVQRQAEWQGRMLALEARAAALPEYQAVAFFHHLLMRKEP